MPGPAPKDPKLRQRKNRTSTAATLQMPDVSPEMPPVEPPLPLRGPSESPWHPETVAYWKDIWASPMVAEYIRADVGGLIRVMKLVDRFNYGELDKAAEIRLTGQCFGLTPLDRRRLQWEIEKVEGAQRRRPATGPSLAATGARDPRLTLRAVK